MENILWFPFKILGTQVKPSWRGAKRNNNQVRETVEALIKLYLKSDISLRSSVQGTNQLACPDLGHLLIVTESMLINTFTY